MPETSSMLRGVGAALIGFALFAAHDALVKVLGQTYSVFQILFFGMLFAFLPITLAILTDDAIGNFKPKFPALLVVRSILMIVAMASAFFAFSVLPLAEAYALLFAMPLIVTVLSVPLLGEVVRARRWAAVCVGFIGILIVLRPGAGAFSVGHLAALGAAAASATAGIVVRKIGRQERAAVLILYPMLMAIVAMGATLPVVYKPVALGDLALMAAVGILSAIAQLCIIIAFRAAPASTVAQVQYSQIVWATLFGALFFNEQPDLYVAIGAAIIISSGVFIVWREAQDNVSANSPVLRTPGARLDTVSPLKIQATDVTKPKG